MSSKLQNYLRTYRKRSGLSQDEVAFLLGCQDGTKVSRYERLARQPSLEAILAYVVVFGAPGRDLFAGVYEKVGDKVAKRAQLLARKLSQAKSERMTARKLTALQAISGSEPEPAENS